MFSLMTKLFVAGFFISVVPLVISQYISFIQTSKTLKTTYAKELKYKTELTTLLINQSISHRLSELNMISGGIDEWLRTKNYKVILDKFYAVKSSKYDLNSISLLDKNGNILISTLKKSKIKKDKNELTNLLKKHSDTEESFVSELICLGEDSYIYLIKKVKDHDNFVALEMNMLNIELLLSNFDDEVEGKKPVYVVDKNNNIIFTTGDKSKINTAFLDNKKVNSKNKHKEGIYFFRDYEGEDVLLSHDKVYEFGVDGSLGWMVLASIPDSLINKSIGDSLSVNKQVGFIIVLITFLVLTLLSRSFVRPIKNIVNVANKISKGDYSAKIVSKSTTSEFETLTSVINDMVEKIKSRTEKLEDQKVLLKNLAHYDTLTNVPNRLLFKDRIEQAIVKAQRDKNQFALFYIDLDEFKHINDSYGHDYGDEVLKEVVSRISSVIRKKDTLARIGGDEFTIVLEELNDANSVTIVADKIIEIIKEPIKIDGNTFKVSTSIGISIYPKDSKDKSDLIKYADIAMYKAKSAGKDSYQFYSEDMRNYSLKRIKMKQDIDRALENNEFEVYYQAQVNARTNEYVGMEALVRWNNSEYGFVPPIKFLPLAEEIGMIMSIDRWVMKSSMQQIVKWKKQGLNVQKLSLNLSIQHLQHDSFIPTLKKCINETGCNGEWIEFEVTETHIMSKYDESVSKLKEMNRMGIQISIDDFGTGYSSLSYLKHLPIDKLKIDKSFINDIPDNEEDVSIVKSIIALCEGLNLSVIAEGVETKEQSEFLLQNGCELIQGYLYAKPQSSKEFEETFLKK